MISTKKLIKLARKWQIMAAIRPKMITSPRPSGVDVNTNNCSTSSPIVEKGHFVAYSADQIRFVLPLEYLRSRIVTELFALAEEEFGLPSVGPLTFPCDAAFIEYVIVLIKQHVTEDVVKALLRSLSGTRCSSSSSNLIQQATHQHQLVRSF
ncbi:SAUR-like auxin-responsive protein family, putative [Theobroma cacao]|uniref:SAUR-like auxin-responsive protein family, putative n=1 Tax=Theobroma cacao TaxID=3641 RepID=A0A061DYN1_THECC|nr:SAUR-like auxin-responsive protein family, putative [Theobroma cacao]